ncbi:MAG: condensation domain-containing protein, partial [Gammaproteobacteria bacterium]
MKPIELINQLRRRGIRISVVEGELELDAPAGTLTEELLEELRASKTELIRLLSWSRRSGLAQQQSLTAVDRDQQLPLSWSQQRLWFLDQLEPGSSAYNISWTVRLRGELDSGAMQSALDKLVQRHEVLHTRFPSDAGVPRQRIDQEAQVSIEYESLLGAADEKLRARLARLASQPFDLSNGPVMRVHLIRLSADEHILLVVIHHIVADGASMRILFKELAAFYEAELEGVTAVLEPLPVQYADFAVWQRNWLDGEELDRQVDYWASRLEGLPPLLELPWDRPRAAALRYRGASVLRVLPAHLADELRALGRAQGSTLFMVMLAAFYVLLMRYSGRSDLVVGTPMGGRPRSDLEGLIGFFINTVVLRADLQGDPTFNELLHAVREIALEAHANQELPFEKLVEVLQPERELSYSPVFQVMFDLQEEPRWRLPVNKLEVIPEVVFSSRTSSFDLTLSVRQAENGLDAMFEYDTDLFDESSIERMARHYQTLLEAVISAPDAAISSLSLLATEERRELVASWSDISVPYPEQQTLDALFERQAASSPLDIAVVSGEVTATYAELNRRANRLSYRLQAMGIGSGKSVALCAERSIDYMAAVLAVLKAGAAVVPVDPVNPPQRLHQIISSAEVELLLLGESLKDSHGMFSFRGCIVMPLQERYFISPDYPDDNPLLPVDMSDIAFVMFTSGSTGVPKAVELCHKGFVNYIHQLGLKTEITARDHI